MKYRKGHEPEGVKREDWVPPVTQRDMRIRDAKHALHDKQPRDERNGKTPWEHLDKVRGIRKHELGAQENDLGGGPTSIKRVN